MSSRTCCKLFPFHSCAKLAISCQDEYHQMNKIGGEKLQLCNEVSTCNITQYKQDTYFVQTYFVSTNRILIMTNHWHMSHIAYNFPFYLLHIKLRSTIMMTSLQETKIWHIITQSCMPNVSLSCRHLNLPSRDIWCNNSPYSLTTLLMLTLTLVVKACLREYCREAFFS